MGDDSSSFTSDVTTAISVDTNKRFLYISLFCLSSNIVFKSLFLESLEIGCKTSVDDGYKLRKCFELSKSPKFSHVLAKPKINLDVDFNCVCCFIMMNVSIIVKEAADVTIL